MPEIPIAATGILRDFCVAGMLRPVDFHLARRLAALAGEADPDVQLAFALAARELRLGSVCVDLATAPDELHPDAELDDGLPAEDRAPLPWPDPAGWLTRVAASPAVAGPDEPTRPFRLDHDLLYLDRYWRQERRLARALRLRSAAAAQGEVASPVPLAPGEEPDPGQEAAVVAALSHGTTVITGGPGTGKTSIVSRILVSLSSQNPRIALSAPTGKAAARLQSAVADRLTENSLRLWGGTLHKLLGTRPRSSHVEHGPGNPLPFDVVVVDETSMVSLELMGLLVAALAPETRLILLGDPHQLRSVEAGAVLADIERAGTLVTAPGGHIERLHTNFRSNQDINRLAGAILAGDAETARRVIDGSPSLELVEFDGSVDPAGYPPLRDDLLRSASAVATAARRGDAPAALAALTRHRILCGHREGPFGVGHWARSARAWLATQLPDYGFDSHSYAGQPLLIQRNTDLYHNGDTAVVVADPANGQLVAVVDRPDQPLWVAPSLLDDATDLHAMTIHKSQGSQFAAVSLVLPPAGSALLTRELLYTAVTRAQDRVTLYGSWETLAQAVATPVRRASGLARQ